MGDGGATALLAPPDGPAERPAPPPAAPTRDRSTGADDRRRLLLLGVLALGFVVRVLCGLTDDVPTTDATAYVRSGESLWQGDGLTRDGAPEMHFPPVAPVLLGGASLLFGDVLTATVVVGVVFGTLLLLPVAALGRALGGDRAGLAAAALAAVAPALTSLPANQGGGSEAPFALCVVTSTWLAVTLPRRSGRGLLGCSAALAALTGAAYLTRPEGLVTAVVLVPCLAAAGWRLRPTSGPRWWRERPAGRAAALLALFVVVLSVFVAPYVLHLHRHAGGWQLSAKTQDASLEAWRDVAERDRRARDEVFYALDESGLGFRAGRSTLADLVRGDPTGYLGIVGVNAEALATEGVLRWNLLPLPVVLVAAWAAWATRSDRGTRIVLLVGAASLVTPLAFFVLPRYLIPAACLVLVLAGVGLARLRGPWRLPVVVVVVLSLVVALVAGLGAPDAIGAPREPVEHRLVGEWLHANTDEQATVMTRNQVIEHYAERRLVPLPAAPLDDVLAFARHYGVDHLVLDEYRLRYLRPQLDPLFEPGPWPGLRLVHEIEEEGRLTRVFVLDPPVAAATPAPPADASFVGDQPTG